MLGWSFGGATLYPWQLFSLDPSDMAYHILLSIRLPRLLCAALIGAGTGVAGTLTQGLFRNPLASPDVIGISSGGAFGAILAFFFGATAFGLWTLPLFAFAGCLLTTLLVLGVARSEKLHSTEDLLLIGFGVNGILSALSSFLLAISLKDYEKAPAMMNWLLGTLAGKSWDHVLLALAPVLLGITFGYRLSYRLNVLNLGADVSETLGIKVLHLRWQTIAVTALIVGTAVSIGGLLPFLGLIVPHITRLIAGPDHRKVLVLSAFNGATLLVLADLFARTVMAPNELQVGVLISLVGSPCFLWMLARQRRRLA